MTKLLQFVHLPAFESSARGVLDERGRQRMEQDLLKEPERGAVIGGTGGVRKLRVAMPGRGRSGGARVIYYYLAPKGRVYLLLAYAKHDAADLSPRGKALMRRLVRQLEEGR